MLSESIHYRKRAVFASGAGSFLCVSSSSSNSLKIRGDFFLHLGGYGRHINRYLGMFASETWDPPLVLNAFLLYSAELEITTIVEVISSGEQRYAKAFVAAGISIFFDKELLVSFWQPHLVFLLNSDYFVICMLPATWHVSYACSAKEKKIHPCSALKIVQLSVRPVVLWDCHDNTVS